MARIIVAGSINMDVVNRVEKHPKPGETVHGLGTSYHPGGKGANQAVAAARAGAVTRMFGAVGRDGFGGELRSALERAGVDTAPVLSKESTSGLAFITVDAAGENNIILSAGANGQLTEADLEAASEAGLWTGADAVLLQNEIPWPVTRRAMELAKASGVRVYLNPAPSFRLPEAAYPLIDVLILNESEAADLTGLPVSTAEQAEAACRLLLERGVSTVVLTLGDQGSVCLQQHRGAPGSAAADAQVEESALPSTAAPPEPPSAVPQAAAFRTPAFPVEAVDTTAAGDTFIGAFAAAYESGRPLSEALRTATAAAALAVTRAGAQDSIPDQTEIALFLSSSKS